MTDTSEQLELAMAEAMRPGTFIPYQAGWHFMRCVERVAEQLDKLVTQGEARRAVPLYETFIGACHEKAEEIDDSSGSFGMLVQDLFAGWVRARVDAQADAADTARILAAWIEDDPYGFCLDLEEKITEVMDSGHLVAFACEARGRLERAVPDDGGSGGYPRRRWTAVLKQILAASRDSEAYRRLCEETGLRSKDCNVLAGIADESEEFEEALGWVERGLALAQQERYGRSADHELKRRKRELLLRLGLADEAVADAWAEYSANPCKIYYQRLMEIVPAEDRSAYHGRAVERAEAADVRSAIELLVAMTELERLARRIRTATVEELQELSHFVLEPAGEALRTSHPELAARVYHALAVRILNARKSKYYHAALRDLERSRDCYRAAGQVDAWTSVVAELRAAHYRKRSFMSGFEQVVADLPVTGRGSSFVDRARRRWKR